MGLERLEEEDLWDPPKIVAGDREICHGCSATELEMRLGDWVWRKREREEKVCGQPIRFSERRGLYTSKSYFSLINLW